MTRLNQKGFTIVEVLVAVVVIAIGLITVAGMQTTAIRGNAWAQDGTVALQMAEEMMDRIRVNGEDFPERYRCIDTDASGATAAGTDITCATWGRPSLNPAQGDYNQWSARLQTAGLASAAGTVMVLNNQPMNNSAVIIVTVTWGSVLTRSVQITSVIESWVS